MLPWWPKEATLNLASEETLNLAGSSRYRWRNHLVMGGGFRRNQHFNKSPLVPEGIGYRVIDASHNLSPEGKDYSPPKSLIDLQGIYLKSWGVNDNN